MPFVVPWALGFFLLALFADRRGWSWVAMISLICLGMVVAHSPIGQSVLNGMQTALDSFAHAVISMFNAVAS